MFKKVSKDYHSVFSNMLFVFVAFLLATFMAYVIMSLILYISLKFGVLYNFSTSGSMILLSIAFFLLLVTLFPFCMFVAWTIKYKTNNQTLKSLPFVTIIVPAFNEQETVNKSIKCALDQNYPEFEVIVVDDGSSDFTPLLIDHPKVKSIHLSRNQGKANAVNKAIKQAIGEYIMLSDSDSHLHPDAIRHMLPHFNDPQVGGVSGQLIVRKRNNIIVIWQNLEYIFSQAIVKMAQNGSGSSITVLPGPICMYKRKLLLTLGGLSNRTLVEDFDMTLEVIAAGYKTEYEPKALAWTSTPENFRALKHQRIRWYRGNLQALKIHKDLFFNHQYGILGFFWLPYSLYWAFGGAIITILLLLGFPVGMYFSSAPLQYSLSMLISLGIFVIISAAQYIFVLALDKNLRFSLVLASLTIIPYSFFLASMHIVAMYREFTNKEIVWNG